MSDSATPSPPLDLFNRVSMDRTSYVIVNQIKELIRNGSLKPGDRLPTERDLCQQLGVSRVTVREALRVLEANGLIQVRLGAQGGSFLTTPSPEMVGDNLAYLLTLSSISASAATEARLIFEVAVLPLVIERATAEDITALRDLISEANVAKSTGIYSTDMSAAFHVRLAAATHNTALEAMMQSFHAPLQSSLQQAKNAAPNMGTKGIREHWEIVNAIEDKDLARAQKILTQHLERTAHRLSATEN